MILPSFGFNFWLKNSGRLIFPIKQSPWESLLSAVTNPTSLAIFLTSFFLRPPIGNITF